MFGTPIAVTKMDEPTEAQVDELHAKYCAAVQALFDKHKAAAGYKAEERLLII